MTVDYSCGGKQTDIALYVWADTAHVGPDGTTPFSITQYNQIPGRLFNFTTNNNDPVTDPLGVVALNILSAAVRWRLLDISGSGRLPMTLFSGPV
jgi:hypothetical protein